jgi:hypothetical protein
MDTTPLTRPAQLNTEPNRRCLFSSVLLSFFLVREAKRYRNTIRRSPESRPPPLPLCLTSPTRVFAAADLAVPAMDTSGSSAAAGDAPTTGEHRMGTTIVGVCYEGGVVLGADSRTSTGTPFASYRSVYAAGDPAVDLARGWRCGPRFSLGSLRIEACLAMSMAVMCPAFAAFLLWLLGSLICLHWRYRANWSICFAATC